MRGLGFVAAGIVVLALAACSSGDSSRTRTHAPLFHDKRPTAVLRLGRIRNDIRLGEQVGDYRWTLGRCEPFADHLYWGQKIFKLAGSEWYDIAERRLKANGFRLSQDPDRMFADIDQYRTSPDYILGARILDIRLDVCDHVHWLTRNPVSRQSGRSWMRVEWNAYSVVSERVEFQAVTNAEGVLDSPAVVGVLTLLDSAFSDAADRLAADPAFQRFMRRPPPQPDAARTSWTRLWFENRPPFTEPFESRSEDIRQSVALIGGGGAGHGSAFFIAPTLLLTNAHVAQGNERVLVTLPTGRQVTGDVLRTHSARDVALIRVEDAGYPPLPIRRRPVRPGESVFALGAPALLDLRGTVSRGTVSAYRPNRHGLQDIQADADVHGGNSGGPLLDASGNVVGLTYAIYSNDRFSKGLNLFIPIDDALRKLRLRIGHPPVN